MLNRKFLEEEMQKLIDTLIRKNTDYGNSFDKGMEKWGGLNFLIRLDDKYGRLESIFDSKQILVEDETVLDTINDIIGYCLLYKHYCMTKEKEGSRGELIG